MIYVIHVALIDLMARLLLKIAFSYFPNLFFALS